MVAVVSVLF